MAITKYEHPNVSAILVESDVTVPVVTPYTNLFCPIISEKGPDRKVEYVTSPEDFIFKFGYPNYLKYGQANYNAYNALKAGAGVYVLRCTPEYLSVTGEPVEGSATYSNIIIGVGFDRTNTTSPIGLYNVKPIVKYNTHAYNITDIENSLGFFDAVIGNTFDEYNFLALYSKGRGEYYNNLGITLVPIKGRYASTYPWYMYSLTIYRNINGVVSKLENFVVSLDPDSRSITGNSYFILDILEKYSKYLVGSFNQIAWDSIETDIGIPASKLNIVNANPFKDDYLTGNTYGKKITTRKLTAEINIDTEIFNSPVKHGLVDGDIITFTSKRNTNSITLNTDYYVRDVTAYGFKVATTIDGAAVSIDKVGTSSLTYSKVTEVSLDSINVITNTINKTGHGFVNGDLILFTKSNPTSDITINSKYYVINSTANSFKISTTLGGSVFDLTAKTVVADTKYRKIISMNTIPTGDIDINLDVLTDIDHGLSNNDVIIFDNVVALVNVDDASVNFGSSVTANDNRSGIINGTTYYVVDKTTDTFKISTTKMTSKKIVDIEYCSASFNINVVDQIMYNSVVCDISSNIFTSINHGFLVGKTITFDDKTGAPTLALNAPYYIIEVTTDTFKISESLGGTVFAITSGTATYNKKVLNYLRTSDIPKLNLGFIDGSNGIPYLKYGYDGKYTYDGLARSVAVVTDLYKTKTFDNIMIKAFSGLFDSNIIQTNETEIDLVLDANFNLNVKQAMIDYSQQLRKDCLTILDLNINKTQSDYLDYRRNQLTSANDSDELETGIPVDTRFVSLISGDRFVFDEITKKNIQVTNTYYLSTLIPTNDKLYGIGKNYVGVNRSVITNYIENKGSAHPTEPEKEELYTNQINYLTKTFKDLYFDSQETTLTKSSALGEVSKSRAYLRIERIAKSVCNRTQWEFATEEVYKNLESSIAVALESFVKDGTCEYIRPRVWADDYAKANKLVYVYVELKFTDIIERVEITFNVAR